MTTKSKKLLAGSSFLALLLFAAYKALPFLLTMVTNILGIAVFMISLLVVIIGAFFLIDLIK